MNLISVGIALGSNLGDRAAELDAGVNFLRELVHPGRVEESPRIETEPVDCPPGSPNFLNSVAEIEVDATQLPPRELLARLQAYEKQRGRADFTQREVNAPRPLDLDILYYGDQVIQEPDLIIPHPRALDRPFMLVPLTALRPDLIWPGQTCTVWELLEKIS